MEKKNIMKNSYAAFLQYGTLMVQWRINVVEQCYPVH